MKFRLTTASLTLALSLFLMTGLSFADSLTLTKIGTFDLGGKKYSEWWYSGVNPTFYGTADNGDTVNMTIGSEKFQEQANVDGKWDIPTALAKGDYQIAITSGSASYNFTLHVGQAFGDSSSSTTQTSASSSSVPSTGSEQTTALTLGLGVSLLALYLYFFDANKKHKVFEKNIVSE